MDDLKTVLEKRFTYVKETEKFFYVNCTCGSKKRYIPKTGSYFRITKCWTCEKEITLSALLKTKAFKLERGVAVEKVVDETPYKIFPAKSVVPINDLPDNHPVKDFMREDFITDFDLLWQQFRVAYIPVGEGIDLAFKNMTVFSDNMIYFPIYYEGDYKGCQLRVVPNTYEAKRLGDFRYITKCARSNYFYNFDVAKDNDYVFVFEGVKSVFKLPKNSIATFGKDLSLKQLKGLQRWKHVVFMFDSGDGYAVAQKQIESKLKNTFSRYTNVDFEKFGFKKPGEIPIKELEEIASKVLCEKK